MMTIQTPLHAEHQLDQLAGQFAHWRQTRTPPHRPSPPELWAHAVALTAVVTNGVSLLQTNKYNSTCWPSCHGHALPPRWLKACNPARNGGAYDHSGVYHG